MANKKKKVPVGRKKATSTPIEETEIAVMETKSPSKPKRKGKGKADPNKPLKGECAVYGLKIVSHFQFLHKINFQMPKRYNEKIKIKKKVRLEGSNFISNTTMLLNIF